MGLQKLIDRFPAGRKSDLEKKIIQFAVGICARFHPPTFACFNREAKNVAQFKRFCSLKEKQINKREFHT